MPDRLRRFVIAAGLALALPSCTREVNDIRASAFADPPQPIIDVVPSAVSLPLRTTADGRALTPDSAIDLGETLASQGRLSNQRVTLLAHTPEGSRIAARLGRTLVERGLPAAQLRVARAPRSADSAPGEALTLVSRAIVAEVPDCRIADPQAWTVTPFSAVGALGCANHANLARMVSDPRDLVRPKVLAPGDGIQAGGAIGRYHGDNVRELSKELGFKSN